jgi:hypothetical protein
VAAFDLIDFVPGLNDNDLISVGLMGAFSGVAGAFSGVAGLVLRVLNFDFNFDLIVLSVFSIYIMYLFLL